VSGPKNTVSASTVSVSTRGRGTVEITERVAERVAASGFDNGIVSVFCRHTSCSLVIMENADHSARVDLERFFEDLVPEDYPHFTHVLEGPDDMPSHIKMALTRTSETVPFAGGQLALGTWQGIFLWEHRVRPHIREIVVTVLGE
jgi:secondary thiamine-phosphate synthase enzyme